jgi:signal transduction histidine kinase
MKVFRWFYATLAGKMMVAIISAVTVGGIIFIVVERNYHTKIFYGQLVEYEQDVGRITTEIVKHVMLDHGADSNFEHLRSILGPMLGAMEASELAIIRNDLSIALRFGTDIARPALADRIEPMIVSGVDTTFADEWAGDLYQIHLSPIPSGESCYQCHGTNETNRGFIVTRTNLDLLEDITKERIISTPMLALILLSGLLLVLAVVIYTVVQNPITRLEKHVQSIISSIIDSGEDLRQLPLIDIPEQEDDIQVLALTFNTLLTKLNLTSAALQEIHDLQLERADRLATTGEMAASLAHEIRNPLAGIMGAMGVIQARFENDDELNPIAAEMSIQLNRISRTVDDLLSYARPSEPVLVESDLVELVENNLILLEQQEQWHGIKIIRDFSVGQLMINADRKMIKQAIWNLATNSMQAMGEAGDLTISLTCYDGQAHLNISDTGGGIAPDILETIFEPFFTTRARGTGLGLSICKRIIEQHKGSLKLESVVGKGTRVFITIPIIKD